MRNLITKITAIMTVICVLVTFSYVPANASADNRYIIYKNKVKEVAKENGLYQPQESLTEFSRSKGWYYGVKSTGLATGYLCDFDNDGLEEMILCLALPDPEEEGKYYSEVIGYGCEYSEVIQLFDFIIKSEHKMTYSTFDLLLSRNGGEYATLRETYDANGEFDCWGTIFSMDNPSTPLMTYTSLSAYGKYIGANKQYIHILSLARGVFDGNVGFDFSMNDFMYQLNERLPKGFAITMDDFWFEEAYATVTVNGKNVDFGTIKPKIVNSRVIIPVRAVAEAMGMKVVFHGDRNLVQIFNGDKDYTLAIDNNEIYDSDGGKNYLDASCVMSEGTTMVPISMFRLISDADISWNGEAREVVIKTNGTETELTEKTVEQ